MSVQTDTLDISQIREDALKFDSMESRLYGRDHDPKQTASEAPGGSTSTRNTAEAQPSNTTYVPTKGAVSDEGGEQPAEATHKRQRLRHTSQPGLPSTIPDSVKSRIMQHDTQSPQDTQPASPWVYEKCATFHAGHDSDSQLQAHAEELESRVDGNASPPVAESQRIDLLTAFDQSSIPRAPFYNEVESENEEDPLTQDVRAEPFPESKRFQLPKTPASHGVKRKRGSDRQSQVMQTPSLPINPFANRKQNRDIMQPSQLFQTTQALTSPLNIVSDGLSERPSPHLDSIQRPSTAGVVTSPEQLPRSHMVRAVTEPQTVYVSMKESQEARERRLRMLEEQGLLGETSEDDFSTIGSQLKRRLNRAQITKAARDQFAGVTAQTQPAGNTSILRRRHGRLSDEPQSSPIRSGRRAKEFSSPTRSPEGAEDAIMISDDAMPDDIEGNVTEEETEREDNDSKDYEDEVLTEENKENIEVPMTESRIRQITAQRISSQPTPTHHPVQRASRVSRAPHISLVSSSPSSRRSPEREHISLSSSQAYAVADSQSSEGLKQITQASKIAQQPRGPSSSLDSRAMVPQSQTSEALKNLSGPSKPSESVTSGWPMQQPPEKKPTLQGQQNKSNDTGPHGKKAQQPSPGDLGLVQQDLHELHRQGIRSSSLSEILGNSEGHNPVAKPVIASDTTLSLTAPDPSVNTMPSPRITPQSASKAVSSIHHANPSGHSTLYETAHEQLVNTPSKTRIRILQSSSHNKLSSPAKSQSQPARPISEIMADPSPDMSVADELDMSFLGNEDQEYQRLMQRSEPKFPTPKRRKVGLGRRMQVSSQPEPVSRSPFKVQGTPKSPSSSAYSCITAVHSSSQTHDTATSLSSQQGEIANEAPSNIINAQTGTEEWAEEGKIKEPLKWAKPLIPKGLRIPPPLKPSSDLRSRADSVQRDISHRKILTPNRVFAHFNGSKSRFYPATCTGILPGDEPRYEVTFDDGATDIISGYGIKRLELREGDVCKVDMRDARGKNPVGGGNFLVVGLRDLQKYEHPSAQVRAGGHDQQASQETDIFGHKSVLLHPKRRALLSEQQQDEDQITVPLARIYFTQTMWGSIKNRDYSFGLSRLPGLTGLQTPSERPSTPSTPSSRTRRFRSSAVAGARPIDAAGRSERLFENMIFTLTNIDHAEDLAKTKKAITNSGGRVLESGFDDLFSIPDLSRTTSPSKHRNATFSLTPAAQKLGFTGLIADRHCRRAKYIQALALGIPCIATRWVTDCIGKQTLLPIAPYLLPAGESSFLSGAVRSRVLDPVPDPATATLTDLFANRPVMLSNTSILLIMQKHEEDAMRHHNFLTHALGATRVARANTLDAASKSVVEAQAMSRPWAWVYTHGKEKETEKAIFGAGTAKKRKRGVVDESSRKTRVVGNEYVIQSLILGKLCDE